MIVGAPSCADESKGRSDPLPKRDNDEALSGITITADDVVFVSALHPFSGESGCNGID
jgi:hypothetical protein